MFYRFTPDSRRKCIDLKDTYSGTIFLCGGHPSLNQEPLDLLYKPGIVTMAMNNTGTVFKPNLWVCADKAMCYSGSIIEDPSIQKFPRLLYQDDIIHETPLKRWKHMPNTYFYGVSEDFKYHQILETSSLFVWWKNVFMIAVQLCHHLGFRKVYCCGTAFKIPDEKHYAYDVNLSPTQVDYNKRTYHNALGNFVRCQRFLEQGGMEFISCTPDSSINNHIPYIPFTEAIEQTRAKLPEPNLTQVKHSSETSK